MLCYKIVGVYIVFLNMLFFCYSVKYFIVIISVIEVDYY